MCRCGHEQAQQDGAHFGALGRLEHVHRREAALANGCINGKADNDEGEEEQAVEVLWVRLVRHLVEEALVQLRILKRSEGGVTHDRPIQMNEFWLNPYE